MELVFCGDKFLAGQFRNRLCNFYIKALRGVQTSTNCGAAQCQCLQIRQSGNQHLTVTFQRSSPAADLLRKFDGSCILQVRTAALYDSLMFLFQTAHGFYQRIDCRKNTVFYCQNS